jgi:hypothetical protein
MPVGFCQNPQAPGGLAVPDPQLPILFHLKFESAILLPLDFLHPFA